MEPVEAKVAPIPETLRKSTATVVVEEATEATVAAARDIEWEQVTEKDRATAPMEETPVVVEPMVDGPVVVAAPVVVEPVVAATSEDEIKWLEELFMVRNIFPAVKTSEFVLS